jgi:hypothetical protein
MSAMKFVISILSGVAFVALITAIIISFGLSIWLFAGIFVVICFIGLLISIFVLEMIEGMEGD